METPGETGTEQVEEDAPAQDQYGQTLAEGVAGSDLEPEQPAEPEQPDSDPSAEEPVQGQGGFLAGTESEQAPGVGGSADHPAPAAVHSEDGELHVAGEPPAGNAAASSAQAGEATDLQSGDVTDPEARAKLNAVTEPEPKETTRPDLGPPDQE